MQQNIRKSYPLRWLTTIMIAATMFISCNSGETKKEDNLPPVDTSATPRPDPSKTGFSSDTTLPPIDTTASSRPDPSKTDEKLD